jgi:hypothetical protein
MVLSWLSVFLIQITSIQINSKRFLKRVGKFFHRKISDVGTGTFKYTCYTYACICAGTYSCTCISLCTCTHTHALIQRERERARERESERERPVHKPTYIHTYIHANTHAYVKCKTLEYLSVVYHVIITVCSPHTHDSNNRLHLSTCPHYCCKNAKSSSSFTTTLSQFSSFLCSLLKNKTPPHPPSLNLRSQSVEMMPFTISCSSSSWHKLSKVSAVVLSQSF